MTVLRRTNNDSLAKECNLLANYKIRSTNKLILDLPKKKRKKNLILVNLNTTVKPRCERNCYPTFLY